MIDPQAKAVLDDMRAGAAPMPADQRAWLEGYRKQLDAVVAMQGASPAVTTKTVAVETDDGEFIAMRLYRPSETGPWPTFLFIHGGGFVGGTLEGYDIPMRHLALRSGWQVAAIEYRLAPEHPFPAAPTDCRAALRKIVGDPAIAASDRLAVGGDSAGGLLAAVVSRHARDTGLSLALQVLLYPNMDLRADAPYPSRSIYDGVVIRVDELYRSLDLYLGVTDRTLADVSPGLAVDLEGLCPALLISNELDPLRDEAEHYGERLRKAGVEVVAERLTGMIHTALQRGARIDRGDALITTIARHLKQVAGG